MEVFYNLLDLCAQLRRVPALACELVIKEADRLCRDIVVVDHGRVIAEGTPDELKTLAGGDRIDVTVRAAGDLAPAARLLRARIGTDVRVDPDSRELSIPVTDRLAALTQIIGLLQEQDITAEDVTVRRPTLDDAFLHLTGQGQAPDRIVPAAEVTTP